MPRILFILLLLHQNVSGRQPPVYYLSVGAGHYNLSTPNATYTNYEQLPEAVTSARIMSGIFKKYAGAKGVTITSTKQQLIGKNEILSGMDQVWQMIQEEKAQNPVVIFYLSGHGFADSLLGSQFLLSGNYPASTGNDLFGDRIKENTYLFELISLIFMKQPGHSFKEADKLLMNATNDESTLSNIISNLANTYTPVRMFIMMDCCRNPLTYHSLNPDRLRKLYGTQTTNVNFMFTLMLNNIKSVNDIILEKLWPVVFSGPNMEAVNTVPFPKNIKLPVTANTDIAPICRKTLQILAQQQADIDIKTFIQQLLTPHKNETPTPVSTFNLDGIDNFTLFKSIK